MAKGRDERGKTDFVTKAVLTAGLELKKVSQDTLHVVGSTSSDVRYYAVLHFGSVGSGSKPEGVRIYNLPTDTLEIEIPRELYVGLMHERTTRNIDLARLTLSVESYFESCGCE